MASYEFLAASYDELMRDADYARRADFVEKLFLRASKRDVRTVLDLACGTGTMTCLLTERGYELISVDGSEDMLMEAREKAQGIRGVEPLFLHQSMPRLDLNDTVDAAICCLDSINYLTNPKDVRRTLERLRLFVSPGGALVFDVHALPKLQAMDAQVYLDEGEDVYCVWRTEFRRDILDYCVDLFTLCPDGAWERKTGLVSLLVEETLMLVKDRNPDRRTHAEISVDWSNGVVIVVRDDGILFDITDADSTASSLRAYLVANLMVEIPARRNMTTTGFNRNMFRL